MSAPEFVVSAVVEGVALAVIFMYWRNWGEYRPGLRWVWLVGTLVALGISTMRAAGL